MVFLTSSRLCYLREPTSGSGDIVPMSETLDSFSKMLQNVLLTFQSRPFLHNSFVPRARPWTTATRRSRLSLGR